MRLTGSVSPASAGSGSLRWTVVPGSARVSRRRSTSVGAATSVSLLLQEAAGSCLRQSVLVSVISQPTSQPGEQDRQTDRNRAASKRSLQLGRQTAGSQIASQLVRQVGSQVAAAASLQQAMFFGALLCSTSPPAEASQVHGLPSVPTYQRKAALARCPGFGHQQVAQCLVAF